MRYYLFLLIAIMLVMGFASGVITKLEPIRIGSCINLPQIEYNSSYENLTFILTPNKTIINIYSLMTKNGFSYNYTFCNTNETGVYTANGCSDISCWNYEFEVTPNGEAPTIPKALMYLGLLFVLLIVFGVIMWAHMGDRTEVWRVWWFSVMWVWIVAVSFISMNIARDFLTSQGFIEDFFFIIWQVLMIGFPFYMLFAVIYTFYFIYKQKDVQNLINRGFSLDEAKRVVGERRR